MGEELLTVCCFFWNDPHDRCHGLYQYSVQDVKLLRSQVARNLTLPHEFAVVTDIMADYGPGIRVVPLDRSVFPAGSRYPKLSVFRPDAGEVIGKRILTLDLDSVVVGNLNEIAAREEDLVLWRNPNFGIRRRAFYNTSIILVRAGTRPEFWTQFDPKTSPEIVNREWGGTDQAWVSYLASRTEAYFDASWGVYGAGRLGDYNPDLAHTVLPANARIVFFPGRRHPGMADVQVKHPWIRQHRH